MTRPPKYCGGFLLDTSGRVVLIRKSRPAWMAGRLNGVGGHVEPGETSLAAMVREFSEEVPRSGGPPFIWWSLFATLVQEIGDVDWFRLIVSPQRLDDIRCGRTDEGTIEIHDLASVALSRRDDVMPNLSVLLPLAAYTHDTYEPVRLVETGPEEAP